MRRPIAIILALFSIISVFAQQRSELAIGVRVGGNFGMPEDRVRQQGAPDASVLNNTFRIANALDFTYAHLWYGRYSNAYGIKTGFALSYAEAQLLLRDYQTEYSKLSPSNLKWDFQIKAKNIEESARYLGFEIPFLFALRTEGFFLNAGPRLMLPIYLNGVENVSYPTVTVVFPDLIGADGGPVTQDQNVGILLSRSFDKNNATIVPRFNLLASIEVGYEWRLNHSDNFIGLGAYANMSVYSHYKPIETHDLHIVDISFNKPEAIAQGAEPTIHTIHALSEVYSARLRYFDFGVTCYYSFNMIPYHPLGLHTPLSIRNRSRAHINDHLMRRVNPNRRKH